MNEEDTVADDEFVDSDPHIRRACAADARGIASVSVRGWQDAYRNLLPAEFLDEMSLSERTAAWRSYLGAEEPEHRMWVIEREGEVHGFCRTGPASDEGVAEVHGLYIEPRSIGSGLGRALFEHALEDLRRRGYATCVVWTFDGNERAERFYEAAGFELDGAERDWRADGAEDVAVLERRFSMSL